MVVVTVTPRAGVVVSVPERSASQTAHTTVYGLTAAERYALRAAAPFAGNAPQWRELVRCAELSNSALVAPTPTPSPGWELPRKPVLDDWPIAAGIMRQHELRDGGEVVWSVSGSWTPASGASILRFVLRHGEPEVPLGFPDRAASPTRPILAPTGTATGIEVSAATVGAAQMTAWGTTEQRFHLDLRIISLGWSRDWTWSGGAVPGDNLWCSGNVRLGTIQAGTFPVVPMYEMPLSFFGQLDMDRDHDLTLEMTNPEVDAEIQVDSVQAWVRCDGAEALRDGGV